MSPEAPFKSPVRGGAPGREAQGARGEGASRTGQFRVIHTGLSYTTQVLSKSRITHPSKITNNTPASSLESTALYDPVCNIRSSKCYTQTF